MIEDNPAWSLQLLRSFGIPERLVDAVDALGRRAGENYRDFIDRVAASGELAVRVKLADLADNLARCERDGNEDRASRYREAQARLRPLLRSAM